MEEEEITKATFINKIEELITKKEELIANMNSGNNKVGNDAVINTILSVIKK